MKLEKQRSAASSSSRERLFTDDEALATHHTETHAYVTPHLSDKTPPPSATIVEVASTNTDDFFYPFTKMPEDPSNDFTDTKRASLKSSTDIPNVELIEVASDGASKSSPVIIHEAARFLYNIDVENEIEDRNSVRRRGLCNSKSRPLNHIYEEVSPSRDEMLDYDILDYYERYSPTTAKALIDTLFLPRHKICRQCARFVDSPVYSDRLVYVRKVLRAKEVFLLQTNDILYFKVSPQPIDVTQHSTNGESVEYMPLCNITKTNSSGILYSTSLPRDVFDLKSKLGPDIVFLDDTFCGIENTQVYHRWPDKAYCRTSARGFRPMVFDECRMKKSKDSKNWMHRRSDTIKHSLLANELPLSIIEAHPNRSSLLMLEPLLLGPNLASTKQSDVKNRISHSEHVKIVRMVIAYTLAFFLLAIITFYIVYFT